MHIDYDVLNNIFYLNTKGNIKCKTYCLASFNMKDMKLCF